jgi:CheY-like chemotaxis protein
MVNSLNDCGTIQPFAPTRTERKTTILVVDDDPLLLVGLGQSLTINGYDVTCAQSVPEALKLITESSYDLLLTDLHMPGAGDGLTVVSAMRHSNPRSVTMILSSLPVMDRAAIAIMGQADHILTKPIKTQYLVEAIKRSLEQGPPAPPVIESVATILERSVQITIDEWYGRIQKDKLVMSVQLSYEQRSGHLPHVFRDLVSFLRSSIPIGGRESVSVTAEKHGSRRYRQGYTAAMVVEESRMLQVSIFHTLQNNLGTIDFSSVLIGVMKVADEIDSQLSQAMTGYMEEASLWSHSVGEVDVA